MLRGCLTPVLNRSRILIVLALLCFIYFVNDPAATIYRNKFLKFKSPGSQPTGELESQAPQQPISVRFPTANPPPTGEATAQADAVNSTSTILTRKPEQNLRLAQGPLEFTGGDVEDGTINDGKLKKKDVEKYHGGEDVRRPENTTDVTKTENEKSVAEKQREKKRTKKDLTLLSPEEYDKIKEIHDQRREHIRKICERFVIPTPGQTSVSNHRLWYGHVYTSKGKKTLPQLVRTGSFQADQAHRVLYCWIYKAGSTSWNAMFARLLNRTEFDEKKNYFDIRPLMAPKTMRDMLESLKYYSFLMVRHPFSRLLSAYRDRIQDTSNSSWQRETYGPLMLKMSRRGIKEADMKNEEGKLQIIPTFAEFVNYLVRTPMNRYDPHWMPYYRHCTPCALNYSAIATLETREQDIPFILEDAGLADKVDMQVLNENSNKGRGNTSALLQEYYSTLSLDQLRRLYRIYELDFQLFDYDVRMVLDLVYPNATFKPSLI